MCLKSSYDDLTWILLLIHSYDKGHISNDKSKERKVVTWCQWCSWILLLFYNLGVILANRPLVVKIEQECSLCSLGGVLRLIISMHSSCLCIHNLSECLLVMETVRCVLQVLLNFQLLPALSLPLISLPFSYETCFFSNAVFLFLVSLLHLQVAKRQGKKQQGIKRDSYKNKKKKKLIILFHYVTKYSSNLPYQDQLHHHGLKFKAQASQSKAQQEATHMLWFYSVYDRRVTGSVDLKRRADRREKGKGSEMSAQTPC